MQHEILANVDGIVTSVAAEASAQIAEGDLIMEIEEQE